MKMAETKSCGLNTRLLPIKAHYFFFYGAMAGTVPFVPVLSKGLGINATATGLVFTVLPFFVLLSKPFFGYLTDYFRNIKAIVMILAIISASTYLAIIFIPAIQTDLTDVGELNVQCSNLTNPITLPFQHEISCLREKLGKAAGCYLTYQRCDSNSSVNYNLSGTLTVESSDNGTIKITENAAKQVHRFLFTPDSKTDQFICGCIQNASSLHCEPDLHPCATAQETQSSASVYRTYKFWIFTVLAVISGTTATTVFCLSDAACYEVLGADTKLYGRQRLWATLSWGIVTPLAGFLNDIATGMSEERDYSPGFYLMLVLCAVDLVILSKVRLTKANFSLNICKDIGQIFSSAETVVFAIGVYIVGALTALIWNYQFWYLEDMGASQTLLGLTVAVQCLVAEVPFFFFSGWFIQKLGHFYCLIGAFSVFTVRLGLYSILKEPWMTLPIEVLHGFTFAVFYASMTGYASEKAPPGTEATMLGVLGGLFEGLGVATGSLLGGVGFDKVGGSNTFLAAAVIALICAPLFLLSYMLIRKLPVKKERKGSASNYGTHRPAVENMKGGEVNATFAPDL